ncbi:MAG: YhjD/YihY/BrkB family envelope integrity protein [Motilibacteraceae bacterium]
MQETPPRPLPALRRLPRPLEHLVLSSAAPVGRLLRMAAEVNAADRAMALAAQALLAFFPMLMVVASVGPVGSTTFTRFLSDRVRLSGSSLTAVTDVMSDPQQVRNATGALGFLLVVLSATSFSRALQRTNQACWGLPSSGLRGAWRGLAWLGGLVAYIWMTSTLLRSVGDALLGPVGVGVASALGGFLVWWWSAWLLLAARVTWRWLLPQAALTATGMGVYTLASAVYMPRAVESSAGQFGPIGVVFALATWLVGGGFVVVFATVGGAFLARDECRLAVSVRRLVGVGPAPWRPDPQPR